MKPYLLTLLALLIFSPTTNLAHAGVLEELITQYQSESSQTLSADTGEKLWNADHTKNATASVRNCSSCHGRDLNTPGKHIKTKKAIKAMAPSVNKKRFTNRKFIEKWFKRNCQWAWGRRCTATEKGHILMFLKRQ